MTLGGVHCFETQHSPDIRHCSLCAHCSSMKLGTIDRVEVFILKAPLGKAKFWSSQSSFPERNSLLGKHIELVFEFDG